MIWITDKNEPQTSAIKTKNGINLSRFVFSDKLGYYKKQFQYFYNWSIPDSFGAEKFLPLYLCITIFNISLLNGYKLM